MYWPILHVGLQFNINPCYFRKASGPKTLSVKCWQDHSEFRKYLLHSVYANYFYDTSVIFSNSIITYREPFTICIGHDRRTDVIGIDYAMKEIFQILLVESLILKV